MGKREKSEQLFREFINRRNSGEKVTPEEYLRKYKEFEKDLKDLFDKLKAEKGETKDPQPGSTRLPHIMGDFKIIREIGKGGMGTVYEAEQISLKRKVALKVLPSHLSFSDDAILKFRREAVAGGRQSHTGIVAIHAIGEHEGYHYIAQELVVGSYTLANKLEEVRKKAKQTTGYFREVAKLTAEVAEALHHAHVSGVIHRDIKPSNIILTQEGNPKVSDFGLAKVEGALALSRTGDFAGTPYYMSPEQAMSHRIKIDHRTDIYSLGVTLYEALTLKRPFEGKTSHEVLKKIIFHEPSDPRKVNSRLPRDLAVICLKAIEKIPKHRYQDMMEFSNDLRLFLNGEVIQAKPATLSAKITKRIRRKPLVSTAVAGTLLILLLFGAQALRYYLQLQAEKSKTAEVNAFLMSMFSSPDPDKDGKDIKVVDVLGKAADKIDEKFHNDPKISAQLYETIGNTYESLGDYEAAEKCFGEALEIMRNDLGPIHEDTLQVMGLQAAVQMDLGKYPEAKVLFCEILETWRNDPGEEDENTLSAMDSLAYARWQTGEISAAENLYRNVLEIRRRILPRNHEQTLRTMNALGCFLMEARNALNEAEQLLRSAFEGRRDELGYDHTNTLQSMNNLASLYKRRGMFDEAERLYLDAIKAQTSILPEWHSDLLASMNNLAHLLVIIGRYPEALERYQEVLDRRCVSLGETHPETLSSKNNLAVTFMRMGRAPEARQRFEEIMETMRQNREKNYPDRLTWIFNFAKLYIQENRFSEAEPLSREVLAERRKLYPQEHPDVLTSIRQLATVLLGLKEHSQAEALLKSGIEIALKTLSIEDLDRIVLHKIYGQYLSAQGRFKEASEQMLFCYRGLATLKHPETETYLERLISLYRKSDQPDKAKEYEALRTAPEKTGKQ